MKTHFAKAAGSRRANRPETKSWPLGQAIWLAVLLSLAGVPKAIAQPIITKQPTSIAVALGGSATVQITASATTPLTFQWQFNGTDLAGAISNRLTLTNVTLADLGFYRVIVRDASSQVTSQPAWLKLARWTQLVAFGDSACMAQY